MHQRDIDIPLILYLPLNYVYILFKVHIDHGVTQFGCCLQPQSPTINGHLKQHAKWTVAALS